MRRHKGRKQGNQRRGSGRRWMLSLVSSQCACHHLAVISDAMKGKGQHWCVNQNSLIRDYFNYLILCVELLCHISHFTVFHMLSVNSVTAVMPG